MRKFVLCNQKPKSNFGAWDQDAQVSWAGASQAGCWPLQTIKYIWIVLCNESAKAMNQVAPLHNWIQIYSFSQHYLKGRDFSYTGSA